MIRHSPSRAMLNRCQHCRLRRLRLRTIGAVLYRAGWPPTRGSWLDQGTRRAGRGWVRVGPYVIGSVARWDESGAP